MQRLEAKSIHGRTYYYLSQWVEKRQVPSPFPKIPRETRRPCPSRSGHWPRSRIRRGPGLGFAAGPLARGGPSPSRRARQSTRSEEHTSELQSRLHLVCRLLLEKKKTQHPPCRTAVLHSMLPAPQPHAPC